MWPTLWPPALCLWLLTLDELFPSKHSCGFLSAPRCPGGKTLSRECPVPALRCTWSLDLARVPHGHLLGVEVSWLVPRAHCGETFGGGRGLSAGMLLAGTPAACWGQDGPRGLSRSWGNLGHVSYCSVTLWGHSHWLVAPLLTWSKGDSQAQMIGLGRGRSRPWLPPKSSRLQALGNVTGLAQPQLGQLPGLAGGRSGAETRGAMG